jgi:hypothetical protein
MRAALAACIAAAMLASGIVLARALAVFAMLPPSVAVASTLAAAGTWAL